jgi:hypothetical protein
MPSDFDDANLYDRLNRGDFDDAAAEEVNAAILAQLLKDNPDVPTEVVMAIHKAGNTAESQVILGELTDGLLANIDFSNPEASKQFFATFLKWLRDNKKTVEDQHLTKA